MKVTVTVSHGKIEPVTFEVLIPGRDSYGEESHFVEILRDYGEEGNWPYLAGYIADALSNDAQNCKIRMKDKIMPVSFC